MVPKANSRYDGTIIGVNFDCSSSAAREGLIVVEHTLRFPTQNAKHSYFIFFQVKINGSNDEMLRAAAEQFGAKSTEEIIFVARETLEGHQVI